MGTQSRASDGPTARAGNDQSWCEIGVRFDFCEGQKTGGSATVHKGGALQWGLCRGGVLG